MLDGRSMEKRKRGVRRYTVWITIWISKNEWEQTCFSSLRSVREGYTMGFKYKANEEGIDVQ